MLNRQNLMCQLLSVNTERNLVSRKRIDKKELAMYNSKDEHLPLLSFLEHDCRYI